MKKRLSLRWRLTLITSVLLTLTCAVFTLFSFYNTQKNVVGSVASQMLTMPASETEVALSGDAPEEITPAMTVMPLLNDAVTAAAPFGLYSFAFMGLAIVLGSAGMYALCGLALRPARKLAAEIAAIQSDNLSFRIQQFQGGDELESISHSFNLMMERVETAFLRETRFSAAAAHELKTPLTVIKTNLDVLALDKQPAPEEYEASISVVKKQTERMNTLVNQLTLLSGTSEVALRESVNLKQLVEEILQELDWGLLSLETALSAATVQGDSVLLKHALSNLIQNAIRYNVNNGTVFVSLSQSSDNCTIRVEDTGIGIREDDALHVFEPFYRVDQSRSRALGGTGLGLSIVKEIVEQHGGSVHYQRRNPNGSVFTTVLPKQQPSIPS